MKTEEWGGGRARDVSRGGRSLGKSEDVPGGISTGDGGTQVITQSECW